MLTRSVKERLGGPSTGGRRVTESRLV